MQQHEQLYCQDVLRACDTIARYVVGKDRDEFLVDDLLQSGIAFQFSIIGEAVRNLSDGLKLKYPEVAWVNARGLRNLIAHRYFAISWPIIWDTAVVSIPILRQQIATILETEFGDTGPTSSP